MATLSLRDRLAAAAKSDWPVTLDLERWECAHIAADYVQLEAINELLRDYGGFGQGELNDSLSECLETLLKRIPR